MLSTSFAASSSAVTLNTVVKSSLLVGTVTVLLCLGPELFLVNILQSLKNLGSLSKSSNFIFSLEVQFDRIDTT